MGWHLPRLVVVGFLALCMPCGCQLVDAPSDLDRGGAMGPDDSDQGGPGMDASGGDGGPGEAGASGEAGTAGEGGVAIRARILCATGGAAYCATGTEGCCYADPRGAGACSTIDACTSTYLFQCSSFGGCGAGEVCCGATAYLTLDGGSFVGIVGSRCTPDKCGGGTPLVLCDFAETPDLCPAGTTCQPWSSVAGNRWPMGYDACQ